MPSTGWGQSVLQGLLCSMGDFNLHQGTAFFSLRPSLVAIGRLRCEKRMVLYKGGCSKPKPRGLY